MGESSIMIVLFAIESWFNGICASLTPLILMICVRLFFLPLVWVHIQLSRTLLVLRLSSSNETLVINKTEGHVQNPNRSASLRIAVTDVRAVETTADQTVSCEMGLALQPLNPLGMRWGLPRSNGCPLGPGNPLGTPGPSSARLRSAWRFVTIPIVPIPHISIPISLSVQCIISLSSRLQIH